MQNLTFSSDSFLIELYKIIIASEENWFLCFLGIRAYEQLGYRAFGSAGKIIAACIITIHNVGGEIEGIKIFGIVNLPK